MRFQSRDALLAAATILTPPAFAAAPAAKSVPIATLVKQVSIPHTMFTPPQRADGDRPRGPQGAGRRGQHLVQCRVEGRARGQDRLRASVRASDVQRHARICRAISSPTCRISARPITTGRPGTTAPIISRRCRRARSTAPCSWKATAWAICSARSPRACSITSAASSRTRSGRATASPAAWSNMQLLENLFPAGHPYHHTMIGSMADLDAASLADVKHWFRDKYGPNNAVLVLAGDMTAAAGEAAGREIFRRHRARAGQQSGAGGGADPCRAEDGSR